ncbi:MAG: hypothetical protein ABIO92_09345 [Chloroflexia bacterium]
MRIKSPLSNLSETINQIKESAAQYRTTLQQNEAATRAVLIDPILQALGWDTANIYMVEVEKGLDQLFADYALYDRNGNVGLIVEAKKLGTNLNDKAITMSMFKYAHNFGTKRIFLTDGLIWQYVTIGEPGDIAIDSRNFTEDNALDCAAYLVERLDAARFWPEEESIDELAQRISQLESNLTTLQKEITQLKGPQANDQTLARTPVSITTMPVKTPLPPASPLNTPSEAAFVDLAHVGDIRKSIPSFLRLPDGTTLKVRRWKDVLLECCKLALSTNPNIPVPLPDRAGKKVKLINWVRPGQGLAFVEEQYKGQTIYIYTNYDANNCVVNAIHVLRQVPSSSHNMNPGVIFQRYEQ